jgi:hypothetical protein
MGAVAAEAAERLQGVRERHAGQAVVKAERERINTALESGAPVTEDQHTTARAQERAEKKAAVNERNGVEIGQALRRAEPVVASEEAPEVWPSTPDFPTPNQEKPEKW